MEESRRHAGSVYRRRRCGHCGKIFVTLETTGRDMRMPLDTTSVHRARAYRERQAANAPATLNWKAPKP